MGFFFLPSPPDEQVPIPDLRTVGDRGVRRPSPDLLDTIYQCQQRQEWYRDYVRGIGLDPVAHVGSLSTATPVDEAASAVTAAMSFSVERRGSNWSEAFGYLRDQAEDNGVLVMVSGVVGSNTRRKLDPAEFRGFALSDPLTPLVFVNGADTKAAQIFTLAHELAHIWLGQSALSDADLSVQATDNVERWCNRVAAEVLVPSERSNRTSTPVQTLRTRSIAWRADSSRARSSCFAGCTSLDSFRGTPTGGRTAPSSSASWS